MKHYSLARRRIPLDDSWDVIVAGGGPAGCTAAMAAARDGARTLLLEATGALGGMGTSGLVPAWCPFSDGEKIIYKGLAEKVFSACKSGMRHVRQDALDWVAIDPEWLKRVYDDMVAESGAVVRFHSFLVGVDAQPRGTVSALLVAGKDGLTAMRSRVYVDCTGDADLAVWAGADYEKGDRAGEMQPASHCFVLSNVNMHAYLYGSRPNHALAKTMASNKRYPRIKGAHLCSSLIGPGTVGFNAGHVWDVDNTDPASVSRGLMEGRRLAAELRDALAEYLPRAFADAFLVATGSLIGARETRRIVGDYVLTIDDYLARRSFPDDICRNNYPVDIHCSKKEIRGHDRGKVTAMGRYERYKKGESHGIPYRCLIPRKLKNVLVAGRSISTDRAVQGSTRVMPVCLAMGEAAGTAAAMAVRAHGNVRAVNIAGLRAHLPSST